MAQELLMTMSSGQVVRSNQSPIGAMEHGKQTDLAMPLAVIGEGSAVRAYQGQAKLRAIQRQNLTLLVHTEHDGNLRRLQMDADHVGDPIHELLISRELGGLRQMRLEPMIARAR